MLNLNLKGRGRISLLVAASSICMLHAVAEVRDVRVQAPACHSCNKYYVRGDLGTAVASKFKADGLYAKKRPQASVLYNVGVGYQINDQLRSELALQYQDHEYKAKKSEFITQQSNIRSAALFLNGYYDIKTSTAFTPYLGAGIGYALNNPNTIIQTNDETFKGKRTGSFVWNVGGGTKYKLNHSVDLDLAYKYANLGKIKSPGDLAFEVRPVSQKLRAHQVTAGLIYKF